MNNEERLQCIETLKQQWLDIQQEAKVIADKHNGKSPDVLDPDHKQWNKLAGQARKLRNKLDLLTEPHEWYLR